MHVEHTVARRELVFNYIETLNSATAGYRVPKRGLFFATAIRHSTDAESIYNRKTLVLQNSRFSTVFHGVGAAPISRPLETPSQPTAEFIMVHVPADKHKYKQRNDSWGMLHQGIRVKETSQVECAIPCVEKNQLFSEQEHHPYVYIKYVLGEYSERQTRIQSLT